MTLSDKWSEASNLIQQQTHNLLVEINRLDTELKGQLRMKESLSNEARQWKDRALAAEKAVENLQEVLRLGRVGLEHERNELWERVR